MTVSVSTTAIVDLRRHSIDAVLERVEHSLQVTLDRETIVRKRRSVGVRTDRDSWVRIERRPFDKIGGQGWNGTECAATLSGVAMPEWHSGIAWSDPDQGAMWRADETELITEPPVKPGGRLTGDPQLPETWWTTLNSSIDALASQETTRVATPDTMTITQARVTETIDATFSEAIDTTIHQWAPAHADFHWANLTAPCCFILDWEDWGMAPRGLDSATLWGASLAVPQLAERVRRERRADLESRSGKLMALFFLAKVVGPYAQEEDPLLEPARRETSRLLAELRESR